MTARKIARRPRGREQAILDVAARHLNTMGVSVEWFSAISEELEITRPALYTYFADREDLLFRCYSNTCDRLDDRLSSANKASDDVVSRLSAFLAAPEPAGAETAVLSEVLALPPDKRDVIWARQNALVANLAVIIEEGVHTRVLRQVESNVVANAIVGMASWAPLYARSGAGVDFELVATGGRELLFKGLARDRSAQHGKPGRLVELAPRPLDIFDRRTIEAAKREGILIAASRLFNSRGIGATRVEDVGVAVGQSKRAIYHHVGQKQALVGACVERAFAYYGSVMDAADRLPGPRLDALFAAVRDIVWAASEPSVSVMAPYVGFGLLSADERRAAVAHAQRLTDGYRRLLERGIAEGSMRPMPVDAIIASLPGVFTWASNGAGRSDGLRDSVAEELAELVACGILADATTLESERIA